MNTYDLIKLARRHVLAGTASMQSSAELCLSDAISLHAAGDYVHDQKRALKSLAYSVGVLHPDYRRAAQ